MSLSDAFGRDPTFQSEKFADAVSADTYRAGYLGPTSYEVNLPKDESSLPVNDRAASAEPEMDLEMSHQHPLTKPMRIQMTTDILKTFRYYTIIRELILWYAMHCQAGTVPLPFSVGIIDAIQPIVDRYNLVQSAPSPQLVTLVLKNSSKPLEISETLPSSEFHELCSGGNLRLDAIGFVLATAGRALAFGSCTHLLSEQTHPGLRSKIVDELLRASTSCIMLCSLITPINDLTTWMLFDNYHLTIMVRSLRCGVYRDTTLCGIPRTQCPVKHMILNFTDFVLPYPRSAVSPARLHGDESVNSSIKSMPWGYTGSPIHQTCRDGSWRLEEGSVAHRICKTRSSQHS